MFGAHKDLTTKLDDGARSRNVDPAAHRLPGQATLAIGQQVELHAVVATTVVGYAPNGDLVFEQGPSVYVPTEAEAYVVAVEDIPDGVYEIWQTCPAHGTHKVYAQWEGDGETLPKLLTLAPVIDDEDDHIILGSD